MECESSVIQSAVDVDEVGVDEPNTGSYWTSLENYYEKFIKKIKSEGSLIDNSFYEIAGSHYELHCGMSFARHFEPVVRLVNNRNRLNISFSRLEWLDLIEQIKTLYKNFFDNEIELLEEEEDSSEVSIFSDEKVKLSKVIFMDEKALKISNFDEKTFYLKKQNLKKILEIDSLILSSKLTTLKNRNFMSFYTSVMDLIKRLTIHVTAPSEKQKILETFFENLQCSVESTNLRECLLFYKDTIFTEICVNSISI